MNRALTAAQLESMRLTLENAFPDTCTIQYLTEVPDGMGGMTKTWTNRGTAIACRISPASGARSVMTAEQIEEGLLWVFTTAWDQAMVVTDRVVKGGDTYEVLSINDDESEVLATRAYLRKYTK